MPFFPLFLFPFPPTLWISIHKRSTVHSVRHFSFDDEIFPKIIVLLLVLGPGENFASCLPEHIFGSACLVWKGYPVPCYSLNTPQAIASHNSSHFNVYRVLLLGRFIPWYSAVWILPCMRVAFLPILPASRIFVSRSRCLVPSALFFQSIFLFLVVCITISGTLLIKTLLNWTHLPELPEGS